MNINENYCLHCPDRVVYRSQKICRRCYDRHRKWKTRGINITTEKYLQMLQEQNGKCLFCDRTPRANRFLDVDHDHNNGRIRGLLCSEHNRAIGVLEKNIKLLPEFLQYIKQSGQ